MLLEICLAPQNAGRFFSVVFILLIFRILGRVSNKYRYPKHTVNRKHEMESEIGGANLNEAIAELFKNFAVKFSGFYVFFDCFQGVQWAFGFAVWSFFIG